jgi:Reverse transcriptase (RNA-dependent DNA polymerase)
MDKAIMLDRQNNNTLWQQAVKKEMDNVMVVFRALEEDESIPQDYKPITVRMIFDVKMDLTRKARLVAGGHLTDPPDMLTYSGVVSKESVQIGLMLAQANGLKLLMTDIGNAYLNAQVTEKYWVRAGAEFGPRLQGKVMLIVRALYGLKSAGAAWNHHLAQELQALGFTSIPSDPNMWMRQANNDNGQPYYEYVLVYVDNMLIMLHDPQGCVIDVMQAKGYSCKDLGEPERYLGAQVGRFNLKHGELVVGHCWYLSAEKYIKVAIDNIETRIGAKLEYAKVQLPLESNYKPELDNSPELDDQQTNYYQSIIGVLQWIVELGRIDIAYEVGTMARHAAAPREGHMRNAIHIFRFLKAHMRSRLVLDHQKRDFTGCRWVVHDWARYYPGACKQIGDNNPQPLGASVQITMFVNASFASDPVTRKSVTGILIFVNGAPVDWVSKRQATIKTSSYGAKLTACRIGVEKVEALRHKFRQMGVPIDGPANIFCNNESIVNSCSNPASLLKKRHNQIAYHKI